MIHSYSENGGTLRDNGRNLFFSYSQPQLTVVRQPRTYPHSRAKKPSEKAGSPCIPNLAGTLRKIGEVVKFLIPEPVDHRVLSA